MKMSAFVVAAVFALPMASAGQPPPVPKPGPEHALFKMDEGVWDATVELSEPGGQKMTSKAVETNKIGCGGKCLITDFKGDMMPGVAFHGHGVSTWDAVKKKYVGSWTDTMAAGMAVGESTWDPAARRMTGWMEGPDMNGKVTRTRSLVQYTNGSRVFTAYATGPDGKDVQVLKITYARRK